MARGGGGFISVGIFSGLTNLSPSLMLDRGGIYQIIPPQEKLFYARGVSL